MNTKALDKIKKCLRLAQSSNAHEAATAMRQAQKLMRLHGFSIGFVTTEVGTHSVTTTPTKRPTQHVSMQANMVCRAFGVEVIYSTTALFSRRESRLEFYGMDSAPEIAGYAFEVLFRQLKRDRKQYMATLNKRLKRATKTRRGDLYAQGWVDAVAKQITPYERSEEENQAVAAYQEQRWPDVETKASRDNTKGARSHDFDAMRQGYLAGKKVNFHQGVGGSNAKPQPRIGQHG